MKQCDVPCDPVVVENLEKNNADLEQRVQNLLRSNESLSQQFQDAQIRAEDAEANLKKALEERMPFAELYAKRQTERAEAAEQKLASTTAYLEMRLLDLKEAQQHAEKRSKEASKAEEERDRLRSLWDLDRTAKNHLMRQRDALQARLEAYERPQGQSHTAFQCAGCQRRGREIAKLKARIERAEKLAEGWHCMAVNEPGEYGCLAWEADQLRAALAEPEPTPLELLERIETIAEAETTRGESELRDSLAALRKSLEKSALKNARERKQ